MEYKDAPLDQIIARRIKSSDKLIDIRAWEVEESPMDLGYRVVEGWPELPVGWSLGQVAGVTIDTKGRYYLYHRGDEAPSIICFDREGRLLDSWGDGIYGRPHMVKCDSDDNLWAIDDGGHVLYLYSPEGETLKTLGIKDIPGCNGKHFNKPTDIAFGIEGEFYISDGYGNKRVAKFDENLVFQRDWGSEGEGEGQFVLPHAITTDPDGKVYVADRTKWRVEIFTSEGDFLKQWTHIGKPFGIVYGYDDHFYICDGTNARVTKVDRYGKIVGFFGTLGEEPGQLSTAHDIAVAQNGDILIAHLDGRAQLFVLK